MHWTLSKLIESSGYTVPELAYDPVITGVSEDSRNVTAGNLFVARKGPDFDGHSVVEQVIAAGAVAVVAEENVAVPSGFPLIVLGQDPDALGGIAHAFYNHPTSKMKVVGITGTNGKTTTTFIIEAIFARHGWKPGIIGTIEYKYGDVRLEAANTTPGAVDLARIFFDMQQAGVDAVAMEASSHAADQGRLAGIQFDACALTNITQDHLDYHKTMESYTQAKEKIVSHYLGYSRHQGKQGIAVLNIDDPRIAPMAERLQPPPLTCATRPLPEASWFAENIELNDKGSRFDLNTGKQTYRVSTHLMGHYNVQNVMSAVAVAHSCGVPLETCVAALDDLRLVPGRLEPVSEGQPFLVLVDYAHTPDALECVLKNARGMTAGKVIVVFGCGGDRDPGKRPQMGRLAADLADVVVVTNDNPRTEDPEIIADQIFSGIEVEGKIIDRVLNRSDAIERAIRYAQPNDTVIIAGKGHEDYQILGKEKVHFDDREVARNYLKGMTT